MSVPQATQQQMNAMLDAAEKRFGKQEDVVDAPVLHHTLQTHPEPVYEEEQVEEESSDVAQEEPMVEDSQDEVEYVAVKESNKEYNFRMLRERAERAEAALAERELHAKQAINISADKDGDDDGLQVDIDDDALVEGKQFKKALSNIHEQNKLLKKILQQQTQLSQQTVMDTTQIKLRNNFPDYAKVTSHENLVRLRDMNPDIAEAILEINLKDPYKASKMAYEMVKQFGIYKEAKDYTMEKAQAQLNSKKPKTLTSISPQQGDTPLSKANAFANGKPSKETMKNYYDEMMQATKGL